MALLTLSQLAPTLFHHSTVPCPMAVTLDTNTCALPHSVALMLAISFCTLCTLLTFLLSVVMSSSCMDMLAYTNVGGARRLGKGTTWQRTCASVSLRNGRASATHEVCRRNKSYCGSVGAASCQHQRHSAWHRGCEARVVQRGVCGGGVRLG